MAQKNWIQGAIRHPGAFTRKAKGAKMSTGAYARKMQAVGGQTGRQARLALILQRLRSK